MQSALHLAHDGQGDQCRAIVRAGMVLDLSPLERTYRHAYANAPGPIILRLGGWSEPLRYDFRSTAVTTTGQR